MTRLRLSILYFLQFGIWGCYLTSLGQFLGASGLGKDIAWFYAAIGIVSIVTPPLLGRLADKLSNPQYLLAGCHAIAALLMLTLWGYAKGSESLNFISTYSLYLGFLSFYMPTMALSNTVSFRIIDQSGGSTVTSFPRIRIWGTVGFIAAMWFVNSAYIDNGAIHFTLSDSVDTGHLRFQYNSMQLFCSGIMGILTSIYSLSLPLKTGASVERTACSGRNENIIIATRRLCKVKRAGIFLIFVILAGVCLQISNGYATPYITHFIARPEYRSSLAAGNATMLFSLSQISEALCVLLVGISLKRIGIKWVYAIGLLAWCGRFLMLGTGNPDSGLWLLIGSMLIYGISFNFITIAGHLYIQQIAPADMKGLAQGIMMFMSNGIGATTGIFIAGSIVNHWCRWEFINIGDTAVRLFMGEWLWPWLIFAVYAFVIAVAWLFINQLFARKHLKVSNK